MVPSPSNFAGIFSHSLILLVPDFCERQRLSCLLNTFWGWCRGINQWEWFVLIILGVLSAQHEVSSEQCIYESMNELSTYHCSAVCQVVALPKRGNSDFKILLYSIWRQWYQSTRYKVNGRNLQKYYGMYIAYVCYIPEIRTEIIIYFGTLNRSCESFT